MDRYGAYVNGEELFTDVSYLVTHKYTGEALAEVAESSDHVIDQAVAGAAEAFRHPLSVPRRVSILERACEILERDQEEVAEEAGKPIKDARVEVARGQQTLRYSAVAARTLHGSEVPIAGNPGSESRVAVMVKTPYGVVLAITPFNFPLNLVLHKRIYVHRPIYEAFLGRLHGAVQGLVVGDPGDDATDVGPMINEEAAIRTFNGYEEAGARAVVPSQRHGVLVHPGLLVNGAGSTRVMSEEAFAPIAGGVPYDDFGQALAFVNDSRYGLQAGVFTQRLDLAWRAIQTLDVGGVVVNDSSAYRADNMPCGDVKDSGLGREGPEFAVAEMTYSTAGVFNLPPLKSH